MTRNLTCHLDCRKVFGYNQKLTTHFSKTKKENQAQRSNSRHDRFDIKIHVISIIPLHFDMTESYG